MLEDPLPLDVLVQPSAQSGPFTGQRLVRDLHVALVAAEQPRVHELFDEPVVCLVQRQLAARDAGADRPAVVAGGHQAEQHVAQVSPLALVEPDVETLGGLRHGVLDPAGAPVALDRERGSLTPFPGLPEGVREQRQRAGLAVDVADQQVDQARLEAEAGVPRRPLDGRPQVLLAHGAGQVQAAFEQPGELRVRREVPEPVRAESEDHRAVVGVQAVEVRRALVGVGAQGHDLLGLVDDQHRPGTARRQRAQRVEWPGAGGGHQHAASVGHQRGHDPGPHE